MKKKSVPKFRRTYVQPARLPSLVLGPEESSAFISREVSLRFAEQLAVQLQHLTDLLDHYEIDRDGGDSHWLLLAYSLARDFVPGFLPVDSRPGTATPASVTLVLEVDTLVAEGVPIGHALQFLSDQKQGPYGGRDPRSLETDYYKRKKRIDPALYQFWQLVLSSPGVDRRALHGPLAGLMAGALNRPRRAADH